VDGRKAMGGVIVGFSEHLAFSDGKGIAVILLMPMVFSSF
jgi:hypothetical protein